MLREFAILSFHLSEGTMNRWKYYTSMAMVISIVSIGCVEKSRRLSPAEQRTLKTLISKQRPKPQHALDVKFEDKVRLLGYDLDKPFVRPGEPFRVTWYWKAEKDIEDGWKLFTHIADAKNVSRINADTDRAIRNLYPPEDWKAGEYIKDVQELFLPAAWDSPEARLYLGLWNGPHRMHITKGPDDGEHRVLGLTVKVQTLPKLSALRVKKQITLDGKLDEWAKAARTAPFVNTQTGEPGAFQATARVMYDDANLYVGFEVSDSFLKSAFQKPDDHLWEQDAVEIMLDPNRDGRNYFEIQASPLGVLFDTRYNSPREPKPWGELSWQSKAKVKVALKGTANDEDPDEGYTVEMAVPWGSFAPEVTAPPRAAEVWRVNFFVMDAQKIGIRTAGWSPPRVPDFHTLDRFGQVVFPVDVSGTTAPAVETRASTGQPAAAEQAASSQKAPAATEKATAPPQTGKAERQPAAAPAESEKPAASPAPSATTGTTKK